MSINSKEWTTSASRSNGVPCGVSLGSIVACVIAWKDQLQISFPQDFSRWIKKFDDHKHDVVILIVLS